MNTIRLISSVSACLLSFCAFAQTNDISCMFGANVPMHKNVEGDGFINVNYSRFYYNGLGLRAGLQWNSSISDVDNIYSAPVAFVYRTRQISTQDRLYSGAAGAASSMVYQGASYVGDNGDAARSFVSSFLVNLFSDMEFFAGVTPGYIAGSSSSAATASWGSSWQYFKESRTDKLSSFYFTIDAGMCFNYSIWRFDIKLMPAFHYSPINNLTYHEIFGEKDKDGGIKTTQVKTTPVHWFFTIGFGVSFKF